MRPRVGRDNIDNNIIVERDSGLQLGSMPHQIATFVNINNDLMHIVYTLNANYPLL